MRSPEEIAREALAKARSARSRALVHRPIRHPCFKNVSALQAAELLRCGARRAPVLALPCGAASCLIGTPKLRPRRRQRASLCPSVHPPVGQSVHGCLGCLHGDAAETRSGCWEADGACNVLSSALMACLFCDSLSLVWRSEGKLKCKVECCACRDAEVGAVLLRPSTKGTSSIMLTIKVGSTILLAQRGPAAGVHGCGVALPGIVHAWQTTGLGTNGSA